MLRRIVAAGLIPMFALYCLPCAAFAAPENMSVLSSEAELPSSWNDPNPPSFLSASFPGGVYSVGDTVPAFAWEIDDADGIESAQPLVTYPGNPYAFTWSSYERRVISDDAPGTYALVGFWVTGKAGYAHRIYSRDFAEQSAGKPFAPGQDDLVADIPELSFLFGDKDKVNYYKVLDGDKSSYQSGSGKDLEFRFDAPLEEFALATMDGDVIDKENYVLESGSTRITLNNDYLATLSSGDHELAAYFKDGGNGIATFSIDNGPIGQAMYRLYNPNSGERFYTASTIERDSVMAAGWNDEGIGWTAPTSGIQVYRLYNSFAGEHHYTTSAEERDMLVSVGWTWEEDGWFSDLNQAVPLYRAYNPNAFANNHHYTTDWGEFVTLLGLGWRDEGVGWHGVG